MRHKTYEDKGSRHCMYFTLELRLYIKSGILGEFGCTIQVEFE